MKTWKGIGIVSGIESGNLIKLIESSDLKKETSNVDEEIKLLENALETLKDKLEKKSVDETLSEDERTIFEGHMLLLEDPEWQGDIKSAIEENSWSAPFAVKEISDQMAQMLEQLDDEYLKERSTDIRDISNSLQKEILGESSEEKNLKDSIVLTMELRASEVSQYVKSGVKGVLSISGGKTSHAAIIARGQNLPYISGLPREILDLEEGETVFIDGETGEVFVSPDEKTIEELKTKKSQADEMDKLYKSAMDNPTQSRDGVKRTASTNIAGPDDMEMVVKSGAEGIALFRTEFLFLKSDKIPTEEEQVEVYKKVAEAMGEKFVIVRTMDIGGDKGGEKFFPEKEENPFLGLRGIRFAFEKEEMFITQLRALLRAAILGNIKIMFPMIGSLEDLLKGKEILERAKESLRADNLEFKEDLEVGIMMEVPSAALLAEVLSEECDFFSIGTNDLMQYTMAADRGNENVKEWNDPYNPGFLKLVEMLVSGGLKKGIHTGMCGDLAGDENLIPFWNAIGIEEYGVAAAKIGQLKYILSTTDANGREDWIKDILSSRTSKEVLEKLKEK